MVDFWKIHRPYFSEQFQAHKKDLWKIQSYCIPYLPQRFPCGTSGKESACQCRRHKRHGFDPWVGKIPLPRKWQLSPVFLPGKFQGQRSLVGYSPWDHNESDTTKQLNTQTHTLRRHSNVAMVKTSQQGFCQVWRGPPLSPTSSSPRISFLLQTQMLRIQTLEKEETWGGIPGMPLTGCTHFGHKTHMSLHLLT